MIQPIKKPYHVPHKLVDETKTDGQKGSTTDIDLMSRISKTEAEVKLENAKQAEFAKKRQAQFYNEADLTEEMKLQRRIRDNNY